MVILNRTFGAVAEVPGDTEATGAEAARRSDSLNIQARSEEIPVGGRLAAFKAQWSFDPWAFSVVSKGLGGKWATPPPRLSSRSFSHRHHF